MDTDAAALRVFERKVLRKIFGPVRVGSDFGIRSNNELLNEIDFVQRINIQRLTRPCRSNGGVCSGETVN